MRRKVAVVTLAAGLLVTAACGDGGDSNEEVCERIDTEGNAAAEQFAAAGQEIAGAMATNDELAALAAVGDAQNAADDLVDILRDGADDAADDELSDALDAWADELETLVTGLDPASLAAGEVPDESAMQAAIERVDQICSDA